MSKHSTDLNKHTLWAVCLFKHVNVVSYFPKVWVINFPLGINNRNLVFPHKGGIRAAIPKEGIGFLIFSIWGGVYPGINILLGDGSKSGSLPIML